MPRQPQKQAGRNAAHCRRDRAPPRCQRFGCADQAAGMLSGQPLGEGHAFVEGHRG